MHSIPVEVHALIDSHFHIVSVQLSLPESPTHVDLAIMPAKGVSKHCFVARNFLLHEPCVARRYPVAGSPEDDPPGTVSERCRPGAILAIAVAAKNRLSRWLNRIWRS